jgi:cation transport regulator ChaC
MNKYENYVFGYGSLVDENGLRNFLGRDEFCPDALFFCRLHGYLRTWNIAIDNRKDIADYKYYIDAKTGSRPDIYIAFLNIQSSPNDSIGGLLFGISLDELRLLDRRERNYRRIEVTAKVSQSVTGKVWTYIGLPEAKQRFQEGLKNRCVVIPKQYYEMVYNAFYARGEEFAADYIATTNKPDIPLRDLIPVEK